jgi:catechol 2,3-dioxygenase-like lactoylglutathione lyase family enzyme
MAQAPRSRLRKLVPSLGVSDLRRSIAFYRDFFGFDVADSWDNDAGETVWCWLRSGVAELMLQQLSPDEQITLEPALGQSWVMYLRPSDIDATREQLLAAGLDVSEIALTGYGARECFVADPDGYELWLSVPEHGLDADEDEDEDEDGGDAASLH